jgi:Mg2+-importing ATPase
LSKKEKRQNAGLTTFPLQPGQILLNNLLSDLPALAIPTDAVDSAAIRRPLAWDMRRLGVFMAVFGLASSVFDMAAFAVFFGVLGAGEREFQTLWFAESLLTEVLVVIVLRTAGPCLAGRPSKWLGIAVAMTALCAVAVPLFGWPTILGFQKVGWTGVLAVLAIAGAYLLATETMKKSIRVGA